MAKFCLYFDDGEHYNKLSEGSLPFLTVCMRTYVDNGYSPSKLLISERGTVNLNRLVQLELEY